MKKIITLLSVMSVTLVISGCATHAQTAALAGAVVGAAVATNIQRPTYQYYEVRRPLHCYNIRELVGYSAWGNPIFQYRRICR